METISHITIQVITKPARKALIKRGIKATHYFEYCEEVGCDIWEQLIKIPLLIGEPVCMWLPEKYRKLNTSEYVQGVEVSLDYKEAIPEGFDVIELPECKYLKFQGQPFVEEDFERAIEDVWKAMQQYDPSKLGYVWDSENPRIQLEPQFERGYIEYKAIK